MIRMELRKRRKKKARKTRKGGRQVDEIDKTDMQGSDSILALYSAYYSFRSICLFFFYILIVNATRSHAELQKGFSALPGTYFLEKLEECCK